MSASEDGGCCEGPAPQNPCLGPSRAQGGLGRGVAWDFVPHAGTGLGGHDSTPRCPACSACTRPAGHIHAGDRPPSLTPPTPPASQLGDPPPHSAAENGAAHHTCGCRIYGEPISSSATRSISKRSNKPHSPGINLDTEAGDENSPPRAAVFQTAGQNPYPGGFLWPTWPRGARVPWDIRVLWDARVLRGVGDVQQRAPWRCLEDTQELGRN